MKWLPAPTVVCLCVGLLLHPLRAQDTPPPTGHPAEWTAETFGAVPAGRKHPLTVLKQSWRAVSPQVSGSPDPPLPFRLERAFPQLRLNQMIFAAAEPGTKEWLILDEAANAKSRIVRTVGGPATGEVETLLELGPDAIYAIEFHPQYVENRQLFVTTNGAGSQSDESDTKYCRVLRYRVPRQAGQPIDPDSRKVILEWASNGHNGCGIVFGNDSMLYITTGDGTSDSDTNLAGQGLDHLLAKVLRIDVDRPTPERPYSIPADNPFVGHKGVRPETWAYGFRNPWRMSVDRLTGDLWVGNNGQDLWEQIYLVQKGANYGWSVYEGSHPFYAQRKLGPTPVSVPTFEHPHSEARSLTGGVVYRGAALPSLEGAYLYGDYSTGKIWAGRMAPLTADGAQREVQSHREVADSALAIAGFVADHDGEVYVIDYQGGGQSGLFRFVRNAERRKRRAFPRKLSQTGLFLPGQGHRVVDGVIPYSVNAPLWSDGAQKERFAAIPEFDRPAATVEIGETDSPSKPTSIRMAPSGSWDFPNGTVLVKSFSLPIEVDGDVRQRWVETRLLTRQQNEWVGYSYRWNDAQTDADLVETGGEEIQYPVMFDGEQPSTLSWRFPSRAECMVCHSRAAKFVLGLSTGQLNRIHDYGDGIRANQLDVWRFLEIAGRGEKRPADQLAKLADPYDPSQPLEARARAYLHSNCAQCHIGAGGGNSQFDVAAHTTLANTKLVDGTPLHDRFGIAKAKLIAPGEPQRSLLVHRMKIRGRGQMPQLATQRVDSAAVDLLSAWIQQLK